MRVFLLPENFPEEEATALSWQWTLGVSMWIQDVGIERGARGIGDILKIRAQYMTNDKDIWEYWYCIDEEGERLALLKETMNGTIYPEEYDERGQSMHSPQCRFPRTPHEWDSLLRRSALSRKLAGLYYLAGHHHDSDIIEVRRDLKALGTFDLLRRERDPVIEAYVEAVEQRLAAP